MSEYQLPPSVVPILKQGALFESKYRLLDLLGQGNFATVVHARHEAMDRDVALKFMRPDVLKSHPEVGERFLQEVRLASRLTNPHTVTIFDFGETEGSIPYMVLEYVDGKPLDYAIDKYGALGYKRSIRLTRQILDSLEEAHDHRIIHRDLKPANIMVAKGGAQKGVEAKVLDFGVAKLVEHTEEGLKHESGRQSTQFVGTPRYMSPEQILGHEVSPASDLYSLGLIFYEMCTGEESVPNKNVAKVAQLHLEEEPLDLAAMDSLPRPIGDLIRRATARHAAERFSQVDEFREALDEAVQAGRARHRDANEVVRSGGESADDEESPEQPHRTSDVFSGEGYLAPPDDEELEQSGSPSGVSIGNTGPPASASPGKKDGPKRPPTPGGTSSMGAETPPTKTPKRSGRDSATHAAQSGAGDRSPSGGAQKLELDTASIEEERKKRAQWRRQTQQRQLQKRRGDDGLLSATGAKGVASLAVIAVAGYVGFVIVGGSLQMLAAPMRVAMAVLPLGMAVLWTVFSRSAYPDFADRVLVPLARRAVVMVPIAMLVLALVMPAEASRSLRDDGLWFMESWPAPLQMGWLQSLTTAVCDMASGAVGLVANLIPWSG